ncbi:MAG: PEP-CTERM sorting domain-containing protein [Planctomycetaceae bacterium]|nr:PEP-CTERM sorting domain-containing protein [Planctomycetaceae bacterium]
MSSFLRCLSLAMAVAGLGTEMASVEAGVFYAFEAGAGGTTGRRSVRGALEESVPDDETPTRSAARRRRSEMSAMVDASTRDLGIEKHSGNQNPAGSGSGGSRQKPWEKPKRSGGGAGAGGGGGGGGGQSSGRTSTPAQPPKGNPDDDGTTPTQPTDGLKSNVTKGVPSTLAAANTAGTAGGTTAEVDSTPLKNQAPGNTSETGTVATRRPADGIGSATDSSVRSLESLSESLTASTRNSMSVLPPVSSSNPAAAGFVGGEQSAAPPIVPEPSTAALLAISLGCVAARRWRSGRNARRAVSG